MSSLNTFTNKRYLFPLPLEEIYAIFIKNKFNLDKGGSKSAVFSLLFAQELTVSGREFINIEHRALALINHHVKWNGAGVSISKKLTFYQVLLY